MSEVYIACFQSLYSVFRRSKNTWSYRLNEDDKEVITQAFTKTGIPYRTELNFNDIPGIVFEDDSHCNCRVIIQISDKDYNIYSHDCRAFQLVYAEKFKKAFEAKGIPARIELIGRPRR